MIHISKKFNIHWLSRYPRPNRVIYDNGGKFTGSEFQELLNSFGITGIPNTVKNPQANDFAERVHLTMGDMLRNEDSVMDPRLTWRDEVQYTYEALTGTTSFRPRDDFPAENTLRLESHCDSRKNQAVTDN